MGVFRVGFSSTSAIAGPRRIATGWWRPAQQINNRSVHSADLLEVVFVLFGIVQILPDRYRRENAVSVNLDDGAPSENLLGEWILAILVALMAVLPSSIHIATTQFRPENKPLGTT